jgi:hypothetical protein
MTMLKLSPIVKRSEWATRTVVRTTMPSIPAPAVVIHHTVSGVEGSTIDVDNDGLPDSFERLLREIEDFHIDTRGWRGGIAYNLLVGHRAGRKAEGRGWRVQSGATGNPDDTFAVSICAMGNYDTVHDVTPELLRNIAEIIAEGITAGHLVPLDKLRIYGHRDKPFSTACPGARLYARIGDIEPMVADILAAKEIPPMLTPEFVRTGHRSYPKDPATFEFVRASLAELGFAPGARGENIDRAVGAFKRRFFNTTNPYPNVGPDMWRRLIAELAGIRTAEPAIVHVPDPALSAKVASLEDKIARVRAVVD